MPKTFYKHKLLFDENMLPRSDFPRLNKYFDIKHISHDLNKAGLPDNQVYALAVRQKRIILTLNTSDFKKLSGTKNDLGIIGIPPHLVSSKLDTKLSSFLMKHGPRQLYKKFIPLGTLTE